MSRFYRFVGVRELLEVDGRGDAERHRHHRGEHHQPQAAEDPGPEAGPLGMNARVVAGQEVRVEAPRPGARCRRSGRRSTMTPKNSENHSAPRNINEPGVLVAADRSRGARSLACGAGGDAHQ